jgi:hypothetical protein
MKKVRRRTITLEIFVTFGATPKDLFYHFAAGDMLRVGHRKKARRWIQIVFKDYWIPPLKEYAYNVCEMRRLSFELGLDRAGQHFNL